MCDAGDWPNIDTISVHAGLHLTNTNNKYFAQDLTTCSLYYFYELPTDTIERERDTQLGIIYFHPAAAAAHPLTDCFPN